MNAVQGETGGVAVSVRKVRERAACSNPIALKNSLLHLLLSAGTPPAEIGRVIDAFPKSRASLYRQCERIANRPFPLDDEEHEGDAA